MQQQLVAGDSLNFLTCVQDFAPGTGWTLRYRLAPRAAGHSVIELDAVEAGDQYRVYAAATDTAMWAPGEYSWTSWVENGDASERYTVESSGQITILPDPRTIGAGHDGRSLARKALDDLRAALAAWSPMRRRYKIGTREMEFNSSAEIIKLMTYWERQVMAEDVASGRISQPARRIHTRI